jgi:hypothetical protein
MRLIADYLRLEDTVRWYEPSQLLLCLRCAAAVPNNRGVESYFRYVHCFSGKVLQQVLAFVSSLPAIQNPTEVELPPNNNAPIDGLSTFEGYKYGEYQYLTRNKKTIATHKTKLGHYKTKRKPVRL